VHQILTNLLDNAIKYTPDAGTVTVGANPLNAPAILRARSRSSCATPARASLADELPRLFERFYRVDSAAARARGTGLGLAIVKHLAHSQGGDVRVESQVDKGSTFFFTLPIHDMGSGGCTHCSKELTLRNQFVIGCGLLWDETDGIGNEK
jgi:two-component system phosphate regulon sensor histidine kinase PhoR